MAHFAQLDGNNLVTQVIVVSNDDTSDSGGVETESIGVAFCQKLLGASTNLVLLISLSHHNLMLHGQLVLVLLLGIHLQILVMHLH